MSFRKARHNPIELMLKLYPDASLRHITYDPKLKKGEYEIIRQGTHDGTLIFTQEILQKSVLNILNETSYYIKTKPDWSRLKGIVYTIGKIKHCTVYGDVSMKERIRFPVICEYIY